MSYPKRGDIYWGPGKKKIRPLLIISNDIGNRICSNVIVMAGTSRDIDNVYPVEVLVESNLNKPTKFQADAIFTIRNDELGEKITRLSDNDIEKVNNALRVELGL